MRLHRNHVLAPVTSAAAGGGDLWYTGYVDIEISLQVRGFADIATHG